jgi:hypothetical protein
MFLSPDTLVPDAGTVIDYNRFMYARGNPLKYTDSSGHCVDGVTTVLCAAAAGFVIGFAANVTVQIASQAIEQAQSGNGVNVHDMKVDWGQAIGSGASGAVTGMFLTGGGSAAGLIATAGRGAIGSLLGGQAETLVTATIHEGQAQGVAHMDADRVVHEARQDGFASVKRMVIDAGVGVMSGATAAVIGPKLDEHLVDRGLASGRRFNPRFIPVMGRPNPNQYYDYTAPLSRAFVGSGVKSGIDVGIEMSTQVGADRACEMGGCP